MSIKFKFKDGITIETIGKTNSTLDELRQEAIKLHKQILEDRIPDLSTNPEYKCSTYIERYLHYDGYDSALNEQQTDKLLDKLSIELEDDSYENIGKELIKYLKHNAFSHRVHFVGMDDEFDQNQIKNSGFTCESKSLYDMIEYLKDISVLSSDFDTSKYINNNDAFIYDKGVVSISMYNVTEEKVETSEEVSEKNIKSKSSSGISKYAYGYKSRPGNLINYVNKKIKEYGTYDSEDEFIKDVKDYFFAYNGDNNAIKEVQIYFQDNPEKLDEWIKTIVVREVKKKNPDLIIFKGDNIKDESLTITFEELKEMLDNGKEFTLGYTIEEDVYDDTFKDGGHYEDTEISTFKNNDKYILSRTNWSNEGEKGSSKNYEFDTFNELKDEIKNIDFELCIIKDTKCKDFLEPISSFKSFRFLNKTKQGFKVIKAFRDLDDDRMHVIAYRPSDDTYIICLGYSPETGYWNQGRYDFTSYESAEKRLKNDYNVVEFNFKDKTEVEDTDEEIVIKKDSQKETKDLTFRRGR